MKYHHRLGIAGIAMAAGVMLLTPTLVGAHSATGPCVDCHTIHNSENGVEVVAGGPQLHLLKYNCIGCHARTWNDANGRAATVGPYAPQVGPQVTSDVYENSGGYFKVPGTAAEHSSTHNVFDLNALADAVISGTTAPGGASFPLKDTIETTKAALRCSSCHDLNLGHAQADAGRVGYRMLHRGGNFVTGTGNINYEADGAGQNMYDADSMNIFCATCHGLFHGAGTDGGGVWIRHPTGVPTSDIVNGPVPNYDGSNKIVPVGDAGGTNLVMCISCHRPHGNANPDMLRFVYAGTSNQAGDATESLGCETCHGTK